jgi:hypothetical protein
LGKQRSLWEAWQIFWPTLRQSWLQPRFCTYYRQLSWKTIPNLGAGWQSAATCLLAG